MYRQSRHACEMAGPGRRCYSAAMNAWSEKAGEAARAIFDKSPMSPSIGIILGTGLGAVASAVEEPMRLEATSVPHFPPSTVDGHAGAVIVGQIAGTTVAILSGRVHGYEGYDPSLLGFGVRVLRALGCRTLIITNAAGGLNPAFSPGDIMVITDHISLPSLAGRGPLVGFRPSAGLKRFVDLTDTYSLELQEIVASAASESGQSVHRGIYVHVGGPNFETPAEVRFLRLIGGDAVGMSTAPEAIVARQLGMDVLGLSVISNVAAGMPGALLDHEDVMAAMALASPVVARLVQGVVARLAH